jgi:hypothetical protein
MSLMNLTTSGWVVLALTSISTLGMVLRVAMRNDKGAATHAIVLGILWVILWVWLLWLVTP